MTVRYVGTGGNDGNSGLTWALRKLTLNGAEDTPVVAGDIVYVGPGVYRETLTCDVSGGTTYSTGTVSVTQGSDQVTGSGTTFTGGNVVAGGYLHIRYYDNGTDGVTDGTSTFTAAGGNFHANLIGLPVQINAKGAYTVSAVASATSMTLADPSSLGWPSSGSSLTYSIMTGEGHYEIESIDDATTLTLVEPWQGPTHSGLSYLTFDAIKYIADVTGENTDGVGGVVRITGSDNDQSAARADCITSIRNYRAFRGFQLDISSSYLFTKANGSHTILEDCKLMGAGSWAFYSSNAASLYYTIRRCVFHANYDGIYALGSADDTGHVVENCLFTGSNNAQHRWRQKGGVTVRNCVFFAAYRGLSILTGVSTTGQTIYAVNNVFITLATGMVGLAAGNITENYNTFYTCGADRSNVAAGANSITYPALFSLPILYSGADQLSGCRFPPPLLGELSEWSQIAQIAGVDERNTDMFGIRRPATASKNSWGPVQYPDASRETTEIRSGSTSIKVADAGRVQLWVPASPVSTEVSVYVMRASSYAGTAPQMIVNQPGQAASTLTDAAAASQWNVLNQTFTPASVPSYFTVDLVSNNTATCSGFEVYFDDFNAS